MGVPWANLAEMMRSRIDSAEVVGQAIAQAAHPPRVWLQASTATIYAHTFGPAHTEADGVLGGREPDVPDYWSYSVHIARAWEHVLAAADTPRTRKVALRTGFTMSPDPGGVFDVLFRLARAGLGGPFYGGQQHVSWLYDVDFVRIVQFLIDHELSGPVNLTAPHPLPNRDFMRGLREAGGIPIGLPVWPGVAELGAVFLRTDVELMRKSRRVVPQKLLDAGYRFAAPTWEEAAPELVRRWRTQRDRGVEAEAALAG